MITLEQRKDIFAKVENALNLYNEHLEINHGSINIYIDDLEIDKDNIDGKMVINTQVVFNSSFYYSEGTRL